MLRALAARRDELIAATYAVITASGGWHLYYTQPAGAALRNTAGKLGFTLDTRGHGGYELYDDRDPTALPGWEHQAVTVRPAPATTAPPQSAGVRIIGGIGKPLGDRRTRDRRHPHLPLLPAARLQPMDRSPRHRHRDRLGLVTSGTGVSLQPAYCNLRIVGIQFRPLTGAPPLVAWRRTNTSAAVQHFVEAARTFASTVEQP